MEEPTQKFKAIIFDFGGVIESYEGSSTLQRIAEALSVPAGDFSKAYHRHNYLTNVENMKWEDAAMEAVREFDKSEAMEKRVREIIKDHEATRKLNTELVALFAPLRERGFKVAILSNYTSRLKDRLKELGIASLVDEAIASGDVGFQKPDPRIFDAAFKKLGVQPGEVIFVDDTPKSLETSAEIGYQPVLFKNNEQLKEDLRKLGVME